MTRTPAQCGTISGYKRHRRNNQEPCDDCREARAEWVRDYRAKERDQREHQQALAQITPQQHSLTLSTHNAWIRERRARGVPPEGIHAA